MQCDYSNLKNSMFLVNIHIFKKLKMLMTHRYKSKLIHGYIKTSIKTNNILIKRSSDYKKRTHVVHYTVRMTHSNKY